MNSSTNKVILTQPKTISLTANTELTVQFDKNIQSASLVNLGTANIYFRFDSTLATASDDCMKLDGTFKGFDLYSPVPFREISFIADANVKIEILNI